MHNISKLLNQLHELVLAFLEEVKNMEKFKIAKLEPYASEAD